MVREGIAWLMVAAILGALVFFVGRPRDASKDGEARSMIRALSQACELYCCDHGDYPPGNGIGSADLAKALQTSRANGRKYFEFRRGDFDESGSVRCSGEVIHYRHQAGERRYGLWCRDSNGRTDGIHYWGGD